MQRFLFSIIAMLASFSSLSTYGKSLTLQEAIEYAVNHSPSLDSAKRTQIVRKLEYQSSWAKFLPSLDLTTTNGLQEQSTNRLGSASTTPWLSGLTLGLTETLYDNGESFTRFSIARLNEDISYVTYLKSRDGLALDTSLEFYRYSLAHMLAEVRKKQRSILGQQLNLFSDQFQQGLKTKQDFVRFQTQHQRSEIDLVTALNSIARSQSELKRLLGVTIDSYEEETLSFEVVPFIDNQDEERIPKAPPAFENTYDLRISNLQSRVNEKNVYLVKRKYWPQIALTSGITYLNSNYINTTPLAPVTNQTNWNVLLTLTYNVWDWGVRDRDVSIAEHNRGVQENTQLQGLLATRTSIRNLMLDFERLKSNHRLNRKLLFLSQESYGSLEQGYHEGKVNFLDLITSLNDLLDAKVRLYTSYYEILMNQAQYRYYQGVLYETSGI